MPEVLFGRRVLNHFRIHLEQAEKEHPGTCQGALFLPASDLFCFLFLSGFIHSDWHYAMDYLSHYNHETDWCKFYEACRECYLDKDAVNKSKRAL